MLTGACDCVSGPLLGVEGGLPVQWLGEGEGEGGDEEEEEEIESDSGSGSGIEGNSE